jgi:hypothetical protein
MNGIHRWPAASDKCKEFREPHRHLFKFIVWAPETESRSMELFMVREALIHWVEKGYPCCIDLEAGGVDFGDFSCEDIATTLKEEWHAEKVFCGEEWFLGAEV